MGLPHIIAHRGYTLHYPENTLPAINAAYDAGIRHIEVDIQLSSDETAWLFHDHDLQRICNQPGALHDYTSAELKKFHAADAQRLGNRFSDQALTTLAQLVAFIRTNTDVHLFIELKRSSLNHFGVDRMTSLVIEQLQHVKSQCTLISYSADALISASNCGWSSLGMVIDNWLEIQQPIVDQLKAAFIFCDVDGLPDSGELDYAYGEIAIFEVADPVQAIQLHQRGVNYIETFACGELLGQLQEIAQNDSQ